MLIEVTEKHIKKGKRGESDSCPIALGMCEAGFSYPRVMSAVVEISAVWIKLPRSARRFIQRFDKKLPVKPFRFKLESA